MEAEDSDRPGSARRGDPGSEYRRRGLRGSDPLEERVDRWVSRGRQLVEGVAGTRPGGRSGDARSEARGGSDRRPRPGLDGLGRWVENRLDWLLEDGDDWREPWEERTATPAPPPAGASGSRRPLEAVSRRGVAARRPPAAQAPSAPEESWPDDDTFQIPRWQRGSSSLRSEEPAPLSAPPARPLPRSSRRRP